MSNYAPLRERFTNADEAFPDEVLMLEGSEVFHLPSPVAPATKACGCKGDAENLVCAPLPETHGRRACYSCFEPVLLWLATREDSAVEVRDPTPAADGEPGAHGILRRAPVPEEHPAARSDDDD